MWTFGGMTSVGNGLEAEEELKNATDWLSGLDNKLEKTKQGNSHLILNPVLNDCMIYMHTYL
jgi:hypothetical protein